MRIWPVRAYTYYMYVYVRGYLDCKLMCDGKHEMVGYIACTRYSLYCVHRVVEMLA